MYAQHSVSVRDCKSSDVEDSMQSFELPNTKAIKVTGNTEQTWSMD